MSKISKDSVFTKNLKHPWQTIEGETIVIDPENQFSFELNETGSVIWNLIDGQNEVSFVLQKVIAEFEVAEQEAFLDTEKLLLDLLEQNLIFEVST